MVMVLMLLVVGGCGDGCGGDGVDDDGGDGCGGDGCGYGDGCVDYYGDDENRNVDYY